MSYLYWKQPYRRKPSRFLRPNLAHEQLCNCAHWYPFFNNGGFLARDIIGNNTVNFNSSNFTLGPQGLYVNSDSSGGFPFVSVSGGAYTLTARVKHPNGGSRTGLDYIFDGNTSRMVFAIATTLTPSGPAIYDGSWRTFGINEIRDGSVIDWAWVTEPGVNCRLYKNGSLVATATYSTVSSTTVSPKIFSTYSTNSQAPEGYTFFDLRWYNKTLEDPQIKDIAQNPWAPFERRIWVPVSAGTQTPQSVAGSITPSGTLDTRFGKFISGSITTTGALIRQIGTGLSGSITATGALVRDTSISLAGTITTSATLATQLISGAIEQAVSGSITATGSLAKQAQKTFTGSITASGALVSKAFKVLTGSITASGALEAISVKLQSIAGSITATGSLAPVLGKLFTGSITPSGSLTKSAQIVLTGSITTVGSLIRKTLKLLTGSITTSGTVDPDKFISQSLTGSITPSGAVTSVYIPGGALIAIGKAGGWAAGFRRRVRRARGR